MIYLTLFWEFFKTGLFAIGGGLATIPFLQEMGSRLGWFTAADVADMLAIAESTPGAIGINMATYTGFTLAGIPGSLMATLGLITPGILIILIIALMLEKFRNNRWVDAAFYGLRPASTGLITAAGLSVCVIVFLRDTGVGLGKIRWEAVLLAVFLWCMSNLVKPVKKLHPIVLILFSAVVGIVFKFAEL